MFTDVLGSLDTPEIHPSVYIQLAQARKSILPHLHTVKFNTLKPSTPLELMLCLSQSVCLFEAIACSPEHFDYADSKYNIGAALDLLASQGDSSIQELRLYMQLPSSYPNKFLLLPNLRILHLLQLSSDFTNPESHWLQKLSLLPHLEELHLSILLGDYFETVPPRGFPSLRLLAVTGIVECQTLTRFLNALPSDRLSEFHLNDDCGRWVEGELPAEVRGHFEDWKKCFRAVARQSSLTSILVMSPKSPEGGDLITKYKDIRLLDVLKPLLSLRGLRSLDIAGIVGMALSDGDVLEFASAWPNLEDLDLGHSVDTEQPSFVALQHLADACPKLWMLGMSIDTTKETAPMRAPSNRRHPLMVYDMYNAPVKDPKLVAQQLKVLFPRLKEVSSSIQLYEEKAEEITDLLY